jgi:putative ABC transport system permease protein
MWLRWSWRDLRQNWVAVAAIALVLAIGTGVYAGLSSTSAWRELSNDASFAAGNMHDLRATTNPGTFLDEGEFERLVADLAVGVSVDLVTERLVVDGQIDVETEAGDLLVSARIVGGTVRGDNTVDRVWLREGELPEAGSGAAVLEAKFADFHHLDGTGTMTVNGDQSLNYSALGVAPEDFYVIGPEGSILTQADMATIYVDLARAQELIDRPGQINDVVITLEPGADRDAVEAALRAAVDELPEVGVIVSDRDDAEAHRILYEDIDNDQQFFTALAVLILFAAALAAFNLVSRIVESQRREIGIGMALGVPRAQLAIRPLLIGLQIALLGVLAGIGVGVLIGNAMKGLFESVLPLPDYRTPFQFGVFAGAALLGFAVPIAASAWPAWRAVRVEPIEAIRTGHLAAKPGRFTTLSKRIRMPGGSLEQMPLRNLLRTPRRTALTALGVGAAIAALVAVLGMLDSFGRAVDRGADEVTKGDSERVLVQLDTFYALDSPIVADIADLDAVGRVDAGLRLPATAIDSDGVEAFDLVLEVIDFDGDGWVPSIGRTVDIEPSAGIVIAEKAAADLGVAAGDVIAVRHPAKTSTGLLGFELVESDFVVSGIHPNPLRSFAFVDDDQANVFGLDGSTNFLHAYPSADGVTRVEMQRALFSADHVASTQAVARISEAFDEAMETFVGFLVITSGAVLVLALLIAFNASRITVEERRRDHATMRAFGLPVRSVMIVIMKESVIVGLLATVIGVAAGTWVLDWMLQSLATRTLPDFGIARHLSPTTLLVAMLIGVVAVTVAPLLLVRRISKMDVPSTLRVME